MITCNFLGLMMTYSNTMFQKSIPFQKDDTFLSPIQRCFLSSTPPSTKPPPPSTPPLLSHNDNRCHPTSTFWLCGPSLFSQSQTCIELKFVGILLKFSKRCRELMNILVEIQQLLRDCNAIVHALARIILDSSENCVRKEVCPYHIMSVFSKLI